MKEFKYILFIVAAGLLYFFTGWAISFVLSGVGIAVLVSKGKYFSTASASAAVLLLCSFFGAEYTVSYLLAGILPGVAVGVGYKLRLPLSSLIVAPSVLFAGQWFYLFAAYKASGGGNMFEDYATLLLENTSSSITALTESSGINIGEEEISLLMKAMEQMTELITQFVPAILIVFSCTMALTVVFFSKKPAYPKLQSFSTIYAPASVSPVLLLCTLGFLWKTNSVKFFFGNISLILMCFFILCGVSTIDFFLRRKVQKRTARCLIYLAALSFGGLILPQLLIPALFILGTADMLFDFRHLRRIPDDKNPDK